MVNKRIHQRFFVRDAHGYLSNPPSGCIIDSSLVEHAGSNHDPARPFDFFMTPASANQGCVLATHFFVPLNESILKKIDI